MDKETKELTTTNSNVPNNITEKEVTEIITNIAKVKPIDKKQRFHMYRLFNLPIYLCAKLAGYSKEYGYKLVREYKDDTNVRQRVEKIINDMPNAYRNVCKLRLMKVSEIEGKALQEYDDDPKLAIDKPQLLKQVKKGAGVELGDQAQAPQTISIEQVTLIQNMVRENTRLDDEPIDVTPEHQKDD